MYYQLPNQCVECHYNTHYRFPLSLLHILNLLGLISVLPTRRGVEGWGGDGGNALVLELSIKLGPLESAC